MQFPTCNFSKYREFIAVSMPKLRRFEYVTLQCIVLHSLAAFPSLKWDMCPGWVMQLITLLFEYWAKTTITPQFVLIIFSINNPSWQFIDKCSYWKLHRYTAVGCSRQHPWNVGGGLTDVSTNVCCPGRRCEKCCDVCLEILNLIYSWRRHFLDVTGHRSDVN